MTNSLESIARGELEADTARSEIDRHIKATRDFSKPYSALLRWTWLALSERRADDDLRHWHRLILDVAARAGQRDGLVAGAEAGADGPGALLAERLRALSDMIRVSIGMQTRPDKARLLTRAHVPAILQALDDRRNEAVARADLLHAVELKTANLSRILTLLILEGLVERQADGRTARFRITGEGIKHLRDYLAGSSKPADVRPEVVSKRPVRRVKVLSNPAPPTDLVEAVRTYFEGEKHPAKRRRQAAQTFRATSSVKTAVYAQGKERVSGGDASRSQFKAARGIVRIQETDEVVVANVAPSVEMLKGDVQVGGLNEKRTRHYQESVHVSGLEPFPAKPTGTEYEYTAFEAMLPTGGPAKSADG